jgi:SNF2 family DNA or RNA helicase
MLQHTESQLAVFKLQMGLEDFADHFVTGLPQESRGVRDHIVIVPKSVVGNWIREFKWCPLKRLKWAAPKRQKVIAEDLPRSRDGQARLTFS